MAESRPTLLLDGRLALRQPERGHRAGTDAVLLAAAAGPVGGLAIDAGAGVGTAGLIVALANPAASVTLVEIDPAAAAFARENVGLNGLSARASVVEADLLSAAARRAAGLVDAGADLVLTNPPWLAPGESRASPDPARALAHVRGPGGLDAWMRAVAALTKPGGRMAAIVRAEDLTDMLAACAGRFGELAILPVHPRAGEAAIRLLLRGRKGGRAKPRIFPGLVLHGSDGRFTPLAGALHRGEATLAFG